MENIAWIHKILEVLDEFASEEFQERVWRRGLGPEVSSYEEAMCRLFDDLRFSDLIDVEGRQIGLSEKALLALTNFRETILKFDKKISEIPRPEEVMDHPAWQSIRKAASRVECVLNGEELE